MQSKHSAEQQRLAFAQLKPVCVTLSEIALSPSLPSSQKKLTLTLTELQEVLSSLTRTGAVELDVPLAEYIFFPLSGLLRSFKVLDDLVLEKSLRIVLLLLQSAWKSDLQPPLARQLLLFFGFALEFVVSSEVEGLKSTSEEVHLAILDCVVALFDSVIVTSADAEEASLFQDDRGCGLVLVSLLASVAPPNPSKIRKQAAEAVDKLATQLLSTGALATFLPSIVSRFSAALRLDCARRTSGAILAKLLYTLEVCLIRCFENLEKSSPNDDQRPKLPGRRPGNDQWVIRDATWQAQTAERLSIVLQSISQLDLGYSGQAIAARRGLSCTVLALDQVGFAQIETTLLAQAVSDHEDGIPPADRCRSRVSSLFSAKPRLLDSLRVSLDDALLRLPRLILQSSSSETLSTLQLLRNSLQILCNAMRPSDFSQLALQVLRKVKSSVVTASEATTVELASTSTITEYSVGEGLGGSNPDSSRSRNPLSAELATNAISDEIWIEIRRLIAFIGLHSDHEALTFDPSESSEYSDHSFVIGFAFALENLLIRYDAPSIYSANERKSELELLQHQDLDRAYTASSLILAQAQRTTVHQRPIILSLKAVSLYARLSGFGFRLELQDLLFHVLSLQAHPSKLVRQEATHCLQTIASSAEYIDTIDLITENSDYLVDTISLRLYGFELTPQACVITRIVLKTCGRRILPMMDDLIQAVITSVDNFHGYRALCDDLFAVLLDFVSAASSPKPAVRSIQRSYQDGVEGANDHEMNLARNNIAPVVYINVLAVARSMQFHLTQSSPNLRIKACQIIMTATPLLATNEDQLLPLINDIWPPLVKRLYDKEAHVMVMAVESITTLLRYSGAFMSTRITHELDNLESLIDPQVPVGRSTNTRDLHYPNAEEFDRHALRGKAFTALAVLIAEVSRSCRVDKRVLHRLWLRLPADARKAAVQSYVSPLSNNGMIAESSDEQE